MGCWQCLVAMCVLLSLLGVVSNMSFIFTIIKHRDLQTAPNKILLSLSVGDFLVSTLVFPLSLGNQTRLFQDYYICVICHSVVIGLCSVSALHLLIVSVERHIAIVYPLRHVSWVTESKLRLAIAACWGIPLVIAALPILGWRKPNWNYLRNGTSTVFKTCDSLIVLPCSYMFFAVTVLLAISLLIPVLYVRIFTELRAQVKKIRPQCTGTLHILEKLPSRVDVKGVIVIFVTAGLFVLTSSPVFLAVYVACDVLTLPVEAWFVLMFLAFSNSLINPLIYGLGNKTIRQRFISCICATKSSATTTYVRRIAVTPTE